MTAARDTALYNVCDMLRLGRLCPDCPATYMQIFSEQVHVYYWRDVLPKESSRGQSLCEFSVSTQFQSPEHDAQQMIKNSLYPLSCGNLQMITLPHIT